MLVWITGLPGSGKTTLSKGIQKALIENDITPIILDGDALRAALNNFSYASDDRSSLAFTYAKLANMLSEQGHIVIVATVSLFHNIHAWNRENNKHYIEVLLKPSSEVLSNRDQKGLYSQCPKKHGGLVGKDQIAEFPINPDFQLDSNSLNDLTRNIEAIFNAIIEKRSYA